MERSWQQDGAQPGPNSAPEGQGTGGELGCCSLGWVTLAGAGMSGGRGLQGTRKRQCLTPEPAALHCFPALTILHVRNWFQKEAPSSKLNRTPPANARHDIFTRGMHNSPLATAPAEHPRFTPGHVPTLPRSSHRQAHQAISDVLITAKPPTAILHPMKATFGI